MLRAIPLVKCETCGATWLAADHVPFDPVPALKGRADAQAAALADLNATIVTLNAALNALQARVEALENP
jgi:hypothetical protein